MPLRTRTFIRASCCMTSDINSSLKSTVCFRSSFLPIFASLRLSMACTLCKARIRLESLLLCCERSLYSCRNYSTCKMACETSWIWHFHGKRRPDDHCRFLFRLRSSALWPSSCRAWNPTVQQVQGHSIIPLYVRKSRIQHNQAKHSLASSPTGTRNDLAKIHCADRPHVWFTIHDRRRLQNSNLLRRALSCLHFSLRNCDVNWFSQIMGCKLFSAPGSNRCYIVWRQVKCPEDPSTSLHYICWVMGQVLCLSTSSFRYSQRAIFVENNCAFSNLFFLPLLSSRYCWNGLSLV